MASLVIPTAQKYMRCWVVSAYSNERLASPPNVLSLKTQSPFPTEKNLGMKNGGTCSIWAPEPKPTARISRAEKETRTPYATTPMASSSPSAFTRNTRVPTRRRMKTVEKTISVTFRFHCRYPCHPGVSLNLNPSGGGGGGPEEGPAVSCAAVDDIVRDGGSRGLAPCSAFSRRGGRWAAGKDPSSSGIRVSWEEYMTLGWSELRT